MNYEIKNDSARLTVSTLGAEPQSFILNGVEYIWSGKPSWPRRAPLLFPMIGPTKDSKIKAESRLYDMPNNGFARDTEFELLKKGDDYLTFRLEDTEEIKKKYYPWGFSLTVTYTLLKNGYEAKAKIEAKDDLYYTYGWHPAFSLEMNGKDASVDDYIVELERSERLRRKEPVDGVFEYTDNFVDGREIHLKKEMFKRGAIILDNVESDRVRLYSLKGEHGVEVTMGDFSTLTIWTAVPDKEGFLCIEPMLSFGDKTRTQDIENMEETKLLKKGERIEYKNKFTFF